MAGLFYNVQWNFDVSCWDVSNVESFQTTFEESKFNNDLTKWNTTSAKYMQGMFWGAQDFDQDLSNFKTDNVENMRVMFE